jgi:hypothetical protein
MEHTRDGGIESREYRYACHGTSAWGCVCVCVCEKEREREMEEKVVGSYGSQ